MRHFLSVTLLLLSCSAPVALAAESEAVAIEVFKAPQPISLDTPPYPRSESTVGNEGWVVVNFMISPKGEPYEIAVVESTGIEAFEKTAIEAVKQWKFEPATLDNNPIDASQNMKLVFIMTTPATGASGGFVRAYKGLMRAIDAGDRAKADAQLAKLRVDNLYEDAFKNLAHFQYHFKWGTEAQQIIDLRRAIAHEQAPRYLKKSVFIGALALLLAREVRTQDFANALKTWDRLRPIASKELVAQWQGAIDEINALKASDRPVSLSGHIVKGTSWYGTLFKNTFEINVSSGQVSEIKLRCEKHYVLFRYETSLRYKVDSKKGLCDIEVIGEHDTKFELVQS